MHAALHLVLVVLVLSAGCIADIPQASTTATPSTSQPTTVSTPEPTTVDISSGVTCNDDLWIAFWGLSEDDLWASDTVRTGYYLPGNTSVLFVTYVDGEVAGTSYERNRYDDGFHADGDELKLNNEYEGEHTVRVVVYQDTNGSEAFERGVDKPCRADGELVQAGATVVDFSRF